MTFILWWQSSSGFCSSRAIPKTTRKDTSKGMRLEFRKAGELLEYLGLAEADAKSPLGWKPTRSMMELIAYRLAKTKPKGTKVIGDDFISELLWHFAYQGSSGQGSELGRYTLHALGLLRENAEGELHATQQLQHIFENSFHLQA